MQLRLWAVFLIGEVFALASSVPKADGRLALPKIPVKPPGGHEVFMLADFVHATILQNDDVIRIRDGPQTVRDCDDKVKRVMSKSDLTSFRTSEGNSPKMDVRPESSRFALMLRISSVSV